MQHLSSGTGTCGADQPRVKRRSIADSSTTPTAAAPSTVPEVNGNQGRGVAVATQLSSIRLASTLAPRRRTTTPSGFVSRAPLSPLASLPLSAPHRPLLHSPPQTLFPAKQASCHPPHVNCHSDRPPSFSESPLPQQSAPTPRSVPARCILVRARHHCFACVRSTPRKHTQREDIQGGGPRRPKSHNGAPATVRNGRRHGPLRQHSRACS